MQMVSNQFTSLYPYKSTLTVDLHIVSHVINPQLVYIIPTKIQEGNHKNLVIGGR